MRTIASFQALADLSVARCQSVSKDIPLICFVITNMLFIPLLCLVQRLSTISLRMTIILPICEMKTYSFLGGDVDNPFKADNSTSRDCGGDANAMVVTAAWLLHLQRKKGRSQGFYYFTPLAQKETKQRYYAGINC